jgi:transcriptional regulator with XRE-family HTH domain
VAELRLREWRERRRLSLRALADEAGVSYVTIARIEGGRLSPTVAMLAARAATH